jgi:glutathione S-transferase
MYTLYWSPGGSAMAPHAVLEEIGARYEIKRVDLTPGKPRDPAYLRLNPTGKVPTLVIDDTQVIYESAAIVMHLADRHPEAGLAPLIGDPLRGLYYQWLVHLTNTLQPAYLRYYYPERHTMNPDQVPEVKHSGQREVRITWTRIDSILASGGPYLLGERFSACDLYLHMLSTWQDPVPALTTKRPNVKRCIDLVLQRPAVQRMLEQTAAAA